MKRLLFGLALALTACSSKPDEGSWKANVRPSHVLGWELKPDTKLANARGMLGREITPLAPKGKRRVLLLGDSFLENGLLMERLRAKADAAGLQDVEFVRGGLRGYATDHYLLWWRIYGRALRPDRVFVFWYPGNDLAGIARERDNNGYKKPYFLLEDGKLALHNYPVIAPEEKLDTDQWSPLVQHEWLGKTGAAQAMADRGGGTLFKLAYGIHHWTYKHVPPYRWAKDALVNRAAKNDPEMAAKQEALGYMWYLRNYAFAFMAGGEDLENAWKLNDAILAALSDEIKQSGAKGTLTLVPHLWMVEPAQRKVFEDTAKEKDYTVDVEAPRKRLGALSKRAGFPLLDLTDPLRAASKTGFTYDQTAAAAHWSEHGIDAVADAVIASVRTAGNK